jgi:hypothetical protein
MIQYDMIWYDSILNWNCKINWQHICRILPKLSKTLPKTRNNSLGIWQNLFKENFWHVEVLVTCRVLQRHVKCACEAPPNGTSCTTRRAVRRPSPALGSLRAWLACWVFVTTRAVQAHGLASHRLHTCADTITAPCTRPDHQFSNCSPFLFP